MRSAMVGRRFGMLIVLCEYDRTRNGRRWSCRCDCGRKAIRAGTSLRQGLKHGERASCLTCRGVRLAKARQPERDQRRWRELWDEQRSLYSEHEEREICLDVRESLEAEFGLSVMAKPKWYDLEIDEDWGASRRAIPASPPMELEREAMVQREIEVERQRRSAAAAKRAPLGRTSSSSGTPTQLSEYRAAQ